MKIYEMRLYIGENNKTVKAFVNIDGSETLFTTEILVGDPKRPEMAIPIPIPIEDATDIIDAFSKIQAASDKAQQILKEEMSKPKIITPSDMNKASQSPQGLPSLKLSR